jgi:hypothetical protein
MLKYPIGYSDFGDIIREERVLVDKTHMIPKVMDDAKVLLFTRPRRFGKTLTLSMFRYFFSLHEQNTATLFDGLNIKKAPASYWAHQGKYPVILLSLKDIKAGTFDQAYKSIRELISRLYSDHYILFESERLHEGAKARFKRALDQKATFEETKTSLRMLCEWLSIHYGQKPILLIDEYDTPIHTAYVEGYYDEMIGFMREFFGVALKDDSYFYKAIVTGILRVAKENLFSGLNNIEVYSFLSTEYAEYFGFTEEEVDRLFKQASLNHNMPMVKAWYNGYQVDGTTLYNPWSIISCIKHSGRLKPYWVNTSDNSLIGKLLVTGGEDIQENFEQLMQGEMVTSILSENLTFQRLTNNPKAILNLLFMSGYLNAIADDVVAESMEEGMAYKLRIPNQEVYSLYRGLIHDWLDGNKGSFWFSEFLQDLREGRLDVFEKKLQTFIKNVFSYYDMKGQEPEKFFHGFTLGLVADMHKTHWIRSNRESGDGRYDVALIPKDKTASLPGFIFEIKSVPEAKQGQLKLYAQKALDQINTLNYGQEMKAQGIISKLTKIGMAFSGKDIAMISQVDSNILL